MKKETHNDKTRTKNITIVLKQELSRGKLIMYTPKRTVWKYSFVRLSTYNTSRIILFDIIYNNNMNAQCVVVSNFPY